MVRDRSDYSSKRANNGSVTRLAWGSSRSSAAGGACPTFILAGMETARDPSIQAIFQPDAGAPPRALVVAGCCGNVGLGKLGQLARIVARHGVPVVALDFE